VSAAIGVDDDAIEVAVAVAVGVLPGEDGLGLELEEQPLSAANSTQPAARAMRRMSRLRSGISLCAITSAQRAGNEAHNLHVGAEIISSSELSTPHSLSERMTCRDNPPDETPRRRP
jgi:hypothetical protein